MRLRRFIAAGAIVLASCSQSDTYTVNNPWSTQETLELDRKISSGDCHSPSAIDHWLLQQSWYSNADEVSLAFGDNSFSDYKNKIEATYCVDGNTIVARTYTTQPRFSIGGIVVQHAARRVAKEPNLKWQVVELSKERLVLKDVNGGKQTVWFRKN